MRRLGSAIVYAQNAPAGAQPTARRVDGVNDWVVIDRRFNGPPNSANGGYTCGLAGTAVNAPAVRVSLRKPPPLDLPLLRRREHDGSVSLLSGDDVIATAGPAAVQAHAPPAPTVEDAEIATRRYVGFAHHRFPTCFVCGTARDDGLRIYAGQGRGQRPHRLPVDAGVRRSGACVGSARLPKRVRDRVCRPPHADRCPRLAHRRAPRAAAGRRTARHRRMASRQRRPEAPLRFCALRCDGTRPRRRRRPLDRAARPRRIRPMSRPLRRSHERHAPIPRLSHQQSSCGVDAPRVAALVPLLPGAPSATPLQSRRSLRSHA